MRDGQLPKTIGRWRRIALIINGINPEGMFLEDVIAACDMLEYTGRVTPVAKWVDDLRGGPETFAGIG